MKSSSARWRTKGMRLERGNTGNRALRESTDFVHYNNNTCFFICIRLYCTKAMVYYHFQLEENRVWLNQEMETG